MVKDMKTDDGALRPDPDMAGTRTNLQLAWQLLGRLQECAASKKSDD